MRRCIEILAGVGEELYDVGLCVEDVVYAGCEGARALDNVQYLKGCRKRVRIPEV